MNMNPAIIYFTTSCLVSLCAAFPSFPPAWFHERPFLFAQLLWPRPWAKHIPDSACIARRSALLSLLSMISTGYRACRSSRSLYSVLRLRTAWSPCGGHRGSLADTSALSVCIFMFRWKIGTFQLLSIGCGFGYVGKWLSFRRTETTCQLVRKGVRGNAVPPRFFCADRLKTPPAGRTYHYMWYISAPY